MTDKDTHTGPSATVSRSKRWLRLWASLGVLMGMAILVLAAMASLSASKANKKPVASKPVLPQTHNANAFFLSAMNETQPGLKRARLIDFITTYPETDHKAAIGSQLKVLNSQEAQDWATASEYLFNPDVTKADKFSILTQYERLWDPVLLGGRKVDLDKIRSDIETQPTVPPSRALYFERFEDPMASGSDWLAGDNYKPLQTYVQPSPSPSVRTYSHTVKPKGRVVKYASLVPSQSTTVTRSAPVEPTVRYGASSTLPSTAFEPSINLPSASLDAGQIGPVIVPAKIKSNRAPKYPRTALEKDVEAMIVLSLSVNEKGKVKSAALVHANAPKYEKQFIRAAKQAALRTRYHPRTIDGDAVSTTVEKTYRFELE